MYCPVDDDIRENWDENGISGHQITRLDVGSLISDEPEVRKLNIHGELLEEDIK